MASYSYLDLLALLGVGSAHPGGFGLTKELLQQLSPVPGSEVLDAGCGTGRTAIYLADAYGCRVTGIDQNQLMLEKAGKRALREGVALQLVQGDLEQLPFADGSFALALSESVLAFTDIQQSLQELHRVLRPGARLAVIEMAVERSLAPAETAEISAVYGAKRYMTEQDWRESFRLAGFTSVQTVGGGTILASMQQYQELPDWDLSPHIHPAVYNVWAQHEDIIRKYQQLLGHRVFICSK
ncbi:class I SAM-dependent methyltransferase [Ectobacillus ponti]|uniref:Class I SAM-dependent methyltransferase n=1 Tax=Ectobacillus ponti TaxID=2961894 RepID=A0AA41X945_9BACI|nr:class I SAM-dependent methyltransferase [Ectobacillus ponti]MCP8969155.1 class I SAM-dependent methyltransferase [Ectobacillus ponti]